MPKFKEHILKLKVTRSPEKDHSIHAEEQFPASLTTWGDDSQGWLYLSFSTGSDKKASFFEITVPPRHFAALAQMMVDADPQAALQAFGKAMANVQVVEWKGDQGGSEQAA
jgi:hypothetical protein